MAYFDYKNGTEYGADFVFPDTFLAETTPFDTTTQTMLSKKTEEMKPLNTTIIQQPQSPQFQSQLQPQPQPQALPMCSCGQGCVRRKGGNDSISAWWGGEAFNITPMMVLFMILVYVVMYVLTVNSMLKDRISMLETRVFSASV